MWLLVVVFLFDPGQIRYRASVRLSSGFFYLLTHHNLYPPNEIPGYAPDYCSYHPCRIWSLGDISKIQNAATTLHYVSKNNNDVAHYNFNAHKPILVIFCGDVAE